MLEKLLHPTTPRQLLVRRLIAITLALILVDLLAALLFYYFEQDVSDTEIATYGDALFWTSSQLTSVSSSIGNPLTTGGRILAVALDFVAIGVVTILVGTIVQHVHLVTPDQSAYFRGRGRRRRTDKLRRDAGPGGGKSV
jgi:hypothetical protein